MERSDIRVYSKQERRLPRGDCRPDAISPDFVTLNPGYGF
jgi:hypothetical protein